MSRLGNQADMQRRALKARVIAADAEAAETHRIKQVLLASGLMLATLLALLLSNP